jgi:hypothetical protein
MLNQAGFSDQRSREVNKAPSSKFQAPKLQSAPFAGLFGD